MKTRFTLILFFFSFASIAQTNLFKSNLFGDHKKSVEVIDKVSYILIKFEGSDTAAIYKWEYEPLINAFKEHYTNSKETKDIIMEAFRVFYIVQEHLTINTKTQNRLVAGSMGFKNDHVCLKRVNWDSENEYQKNLNEAIKRFKTNNDKKEAKTYKNFIVKGDDEITDNLLDETKRYSKAELKKYGPKNFKNYLDKEITHTYLYFLDSTEKALTKYNILSNKIKISENDTAYLNKEIQTLETHTLNLNNLGVIIKEKIKGLEKETEKIKNLEQIFRDSLGTMSPVQQIPDSLFKGRFAPVIKFKQLSFLQSFEKLIANYIINTVTVNNKFRTKTDSIQHILIQIDNERKSLLLKELSEYRKDLTENSKNLEKTIQKTKSIKDSALIEFSFDILNMEIDSIEVAINQTFIENILAFGKIEYYDFQKNNKIELNQTYVTLRNKFPIGISSLNSIDRNNANTKLYTIINGEKYEVELYKVMAYYRPKVKSCRRDLSPADTSFSIVKEKGLQNVVLFKSPSQKLFEFKIFSDFMGMNGTNPNGLVQTEFSKEMYLNSYKHLFRQIQKGSAYWGWGAYISPNILISKFEKMKKYLPITEINDTSYVSTLNLKQYEIYSVGADLNLFTLSIPSAKSIFYVDLGLAYSGVGVADSTKNVKDSVIVIKDHSLNTLTWKLLARCNVQTDERYFFEMRGGLQYIKLLTDDITQLALLDKMDLEKSWRNKALYSVELFAGYSPTSNTKGKLFLRYRYFGSFTKKVYEGYSQIQLGYSYYFDK